MDISSVNTTLQVLSFSGHFYAFGLESIKDITTLTRSVLFIETTDRSLHYVLVLPKQHGV